MGIDPDEPGLLPGSAGSDCRFSRDVQFRRLHAPVVDSVVVLVVRHHARRGLHDLAVHEDLLAVFVTVGVTQDALPPHDMPGVPVEPVKVRGVDDRILTVAQRDVLDLRPRRRLDSAARLLLGLEVPAALARVHLPDLARARGVVQAQRQNQLRLRQVARRMRPDRVEQVDATRAPALDRGRGPPAPG